MLLRNHQFGFSMNVSRRASFVIRQLRCVKRSLRQCSSAKDTKPRITPKMVMNEVYASPQHYFTDDEKSLRTSVTTLQDTCENDYLCIFSYNQFGFRLTNGVFVVGPMAVFGGVALSWKVAKLDEITEDSLSLLTMVEPKPDHIVLGAGDRENVQVLEKRLRPFFRKSGLSVDIMATSDACPTLNYLNADQRYVVGLLFPVSQLSKEKFSHLDSNFERALTREMDQSVPAMVLGIPSKSIPNALRDLIEERRQELKEKEELEKNMNK
uniref:NADH dehydrogenase [ubiquinone] 1 alpha subcomplex assembly factor 3 n=2 Tax=Trichuris muris TaxID=70415 RepID=A0A5S6Q3B2_TRIMR